MGEQKLFNLPGENFLAAAANHVLQTAGDFDVILRIHNRQVATVQPAGRVDGLLRAFGIVVVTAHDVVTAVAQFPMLAPRQNLARCRVDNPLFLVRHDFADRADSQFQGVVHFGHVANWRSLGHAAGDGDFTTMHFRHHAFHQFGRARRAGHDARAQGRQIKLAELRMVQLGDEHRGHPVQCRAALFRHTLQSVHRTEMRRGQHHCRAVRHAGKVAQHHAEAVIERHGDAESVEVTEPHALADPEAVVEDVVVREHRALGKASGAGGVLDVDNVIEIERGLPLSQGVRCDAFGAG